MVVKNICPVHRGHEFSSLSIVYIGIAIYYNVIVFDYFSLRCLEMMVKPNRKWLFLIWIPCQEDRLEKLSSWKLTEKLLNQENVLKHKYAMYN